MSIVLNSSGGGSVTINEPSTASNFTLTLPAATGTAMVSGNMPSFSAYASSAQTVTTNVATKVVFDTEVFDTNNNFASNRFTPTVAGYYQINTGVQFLGAATPYLQIFKNGSVYSNLISVAMVNGILHDSNLIYCNGSSDYIEIYATSFGGTQFNSGQENTWFTGVMVRSA